MVRDISVSACGHHKRTGDIESAGDSIADPTTPMRRYGPAAGLPSKFQSFPPPTNNLPPRVYPGTIAAPYQPYQSTQQYHHHAANLQDSTFSRPDIMPDSIAPAPATSCWSNVPPLRQPAQYMEQQGDPSYLGPHVNPAFDATYDLFTDLTQASGQLPRHPPTVNQPNSTAFSAQDSVATTNPYELSAPSVFYNPTAHPSFFRPGTQG
jgi:hypothetical protein